MAKSSQAPFPSPVLLPHTWTGLQETLLAHSLGAGEVQIIQLRQVHYCRHRKSIWMANKDMKMVLNIISQ